MEQLSLNTPGVRSQLHRGSDWCGGAVKRNVTTDIAAGSVTMQGAHDMFRHCSLTMSESEGPGDCLHKVQRFFHVAVDVMNRKVNSSMLKTVPGSRKIHHLRVLAENVLATSSRLFSVDFACRETSPNASLQVMLKLGRQ